MEKDHSLIKRIEELVEKLIFASRWILAPFYIGMVLALVLLAFKFIQEFVLSAPALSACLKPTPCWAFWA